MTIKEVSEKFHMTADTLRYYEKIGLIDPVKRNASGVRDYQEADLKRIEFLRCMRLSGLSIGMLTKYLELSDRGDETIGQCKEILLQQRAEILAKMQELQDTLDHLNHKIDTYDEKIGKKIS